MKFIKQKTPYKDEIGDILYGKEYVKDINFSDLKKKKYTYIIRDLMFRDKDFKESLKDSLNKIFRYNCPFINGNKHYYFFPAFIFTDNCDKENVYNQFMDSWKDDVIKDIKNNENFFTEKLYMGHGYDFGCLPHDGYNEKKIVCVETDSGDVLVGKVFVWFNK